MHCVCFGWCRGQAVQSCLCLAAMVLAHRLVCIFLVCTWLAVHVCVYKSVIVLVAYRAYNGGTSAPQGFIRA